MSEERVTVSVKRDHIHLMNTLFRWDVPTQKWVAQPENFYAQPNMAFHMGNFVGALNQAEKQQYPNPTEPPAPPPPAPPVVLPPDCPVTLDIKDEFTQATRGDPSHPDQNVLVVNMWKDAVIVIPFRVPMPKNGSFFTMNDMVGAAICEFRTPPTYRQATLSRAPGDFGKQNSEGAILPDNNVIASGGLTPNMYFFLKDGWAKPGDMVYFNCRLWMIDYDTNKGKTSLAPEQFDKPQTIRFSVQWPRDNP